MVLRYILLCKSISLADNGAAYDADVEIQVFCHFADDSKLLRIFFAEISIVRRYNMKKFCDYCAYTLKMNEPCFSAKSFGQCMDAYIGAGVVVHFFRSWVEDHICAKFPAEFAVAGKVSRIGIIILSRSELRGIHKYRDDNTIIFFAALAYKACMAFVKISHRRDKTDTESFFYGFEDSLVLIRLLDHVCQTTMFFVISNSADPVVLIHKNNGRFMYGCFGNVIISVSHNNNSVTG